MPGVKAKHFWKGYGKDRVTVTVTHLAGVPTLPSPRRRKREGRSPKVEAHIADAVKKGPRWF